MPARRPSRLPTLLGLAWAWAGCVTLPASGQTGETWRSTLYPPKAKAPTASQSFASDAILQDFSYAGFRRGEEALPQPAGPFFDVTHHGADPSGNLDSTAAIQTAIQAAAGAGGGVVFLPAGTFRVSPPAGSNHCLRVSASHIVLRGAGIGQTFLLNSSYQMRDRAVIRIGPASTSTQNTTRILSDLTGPTRRLPMASTGPFAVGHLIRLEWDFTEDWITEHRQQTWWNGTARPSPARYLREITAVNHAEGWIEVDAPLRYSALTRDDARISRVSGMLRNVGIESLSLGNLQHPGSGWGESDYTDPTKAAYDTHNSWLIDFADVHDSWARNIASFQAQENTSTCHLLSNGIRLLRSCRVTLRDITLRRAQYGGGGGNGYLYRLQQANECLLERCVADFSRHGIVLSHAGTSGNVFHLCEDRNTARATGSSGSYTTSGSGSDHHMHFSHSNLFDRCLAHNSFFTAHHRGSSGTTPHALTAAHTVYWNTRGSGTRFPTIVRSEQARLGYVIGTSGTVNGASNPTGGNTAPADHLEGIGTGETLDPPSLYLDQLSRRLDPPLEIELTGSPTRFPDNTLRLQATLLRGETEIPSPDAILFTARTSPPGSQITALAADSREPRFAVSQPGRYTFQVLASHQGKTASASLEIEALPPLPASLAHDLPATADSYVRGAPYENENHGSATELLLKDDGSAHVRREAYLRFDLSGFSPADFDTATLHQFFTSTDTPATAITSTVSDPGWLENTLTWSNRPTTQTASLGSWQVPANDWLHLDATAAVQAGLAQSPTLTFRHQILTQPSGPVYRFASREAADPSLHPFLRLTRLAPSFEAWISRFDNLPENERKPLDDPDGDTLPNLAEAWFGTHPALPQTANLIETKLENHQFTLRLTRNRIPPAGLYAIVETSPSLTHDSWQPAPDTTWHDDPALVPDGDSIPTLVTIPLPAATDRVFYRIRIADTQWNEEQP